jgi:RNA polymerase sigma-70 factor (ECF subfamily)
VYAHGADAPVIRGDAAGAPPKLADWEQVLLHQVRAQMPPDPPAPVRVDHELQDGEQVDLGDGVEAVAVAVPGHTPGSVAFYLPEPRVLRLIFTCCHPALSREAQVALSLRTLARLEVPAIARAFLVPETTMAKRLVRAGAKITTARIPYAIPSDTELPGRLAAVLAVVYLIATEAHAPTGGDAVARVDLEAEAIRLARLLASLMPDEPETLSLLALLLLTSARTSARTDADGNPVTLADQNRTRWNRAAIAEGSAWLSEAVARSGGVAGPYQFQAHLAAAHSTAPSWQKTDWDRIIGLYDLLGSITASPVVALNRAVAVTERDGPEAGLAALKTIAGLEYSHLWHAALADNLCRLGRTSDAAGELHTAVTLAPSEVEQRLLQGRLRKVRSELG